MDNIPVDLATAECIRLGADDVIILAAGEQMAGDLLAVEITMRPGGGPPLMHRHAPSEIYFVTRGAFTFYIGEGADARRVVVGAGGVVPLPGNIPHAIRNESEDDAVAYSVHAPGALMEGFTRAAAQLAAGGPPNMASVLATAEEHGIEMLGPIPNLT